MGNVTDMCQAIDPVKDDDYKTFKEKSQSRYEEMLEQTLDSMKDASPQQLSLIHI